MRRYFVLGLVSLLLAAAAAQQTPKPENLLVNGGFDQGPDPGGYKLYTAKDKFAGWTVSAGSIDHIGTYFKCAHKWCLDLNGNEMGTIRQTVATESGRKYEVAFSLSANPQCGDKLKTVRVSAAGQAKTFTYTAKDPMTFVRRTWEFTANADKTVLSFQSRKQNSACGPLLDSISMTLVPAEEKSAQ